MNSAEPPAGWVEMRPGFLLRASEIESLEWDKEGWTNVRTRSGHDYSIPQKRPDEIASIIMSRPDGGS